MANINASTTIITRSSAFDKRTTFLVEAAKGGHLEIVKYLLEKGGNINDKDDKCRTALIYASMSVDLETVKYLIEKGADVNAKDNNGSTALMDASSGGCLEIIKYLIENGADINDKDNDGSTALIYASRKGHLETVEYLLEKGADVNIKNNNGETALDFAKKELQELQSIQHMRMQQPSFLTVNIIEENGNKIIKVLKKKMVDVATEYENTEYEIIKILKEIRALKE